MWLNKNIHHIHCVGIGGIGMSAIAALLHNKGYRVTGSDLAESTLTKELQARGITIVYQHASENVKGADLVVYSSAITNANVEMVEAKAMRIPTVRRAEILVELMESFKAIAISGTHGKTTTTSLITWILKQADLDPSFMVGGIVHGLVEHVSLGNGEYFVSETDESDASFLCFSPYIAVVTNIEPDHLNTYGGDFEKLKHTFLQFLKRLDKDGLCVLGIDSPAVTACLPEITHPVITYGFHSKADYRARNVNYSGLQTTFEVVRPQQTNLNIRLNLPGQHNVQNALAAIAVASALHVKDEVIQQACLSFKGVVRRFNIHGERQFAHGNALLIDDYGHHPTALDHVLSTAKQVFPDRRIVLVFQPHRYSRTQDLFQDFVKALSKSHVLILAEVYGAGEQPIEGVNSKRLYEHVLPLKHHKDTYLASRLSDIPIILNDIVQEKDVILLQGAGDIIKLSHEL
jgi:UDP-N-acetylmuramate--alanine ligase